MGSSYTVWAIIPASGIGQRMQADRPKQYLEYCGKTILEHTLDRLLSCPLVYGAILVLNENDNYWPKIRYNPVKPLHVTTGGDHRQDSVMNGLAMLLDIYDDVYALVHDAVRPLVPRDDLVKLIQSLQFSNQGALLAAPVTDTLKKRSQSGFVENTINRDGIWRALTPQLFNAEVLSQALELAKQSGNILTDDSSAIEAIGQRPMLVEGSSENIKITLPADLALAELIWKKQQSVSD